MNADSRGTGTAAGLLEAWRRWVAAESDRRGLAGLGRVADGLARSTAVLREADWNPDVSAVARGPEAPGD